MSRRRLVGVFALCVVVCLRFAPLAAPAEKCTTVEPFSGKDLTGWAVKGDAKQSKWVVGTASLDPKDPGKLQATPGGKELINLATSLDLYTKEKFGDARYEIEVMVPRGSNSGIYIMGEYEIQVLDSYGKQHVGKGDMGAVYGISAPRVNSSKAPGQWQQFVIEYRAPRFDAQGKKTANAEVLKVTLNGQVIQENVPVPHVLGGGVSGREAPTGPLMFQGNHGAVAYRNIRITPLRAK
jgi:hypothetical protein